MSALTDLVEQIQGEVGAKVDGDFGVQTATLVLARLTGAAVEPVVLVATPPSTNKPVWPKEADAGEFYGSRPTLTQIETPYPMRMDDGGKWVPITKITCHVKVAASLRRVLEAIKVGLGSQAAIQAAGADVYDGVYNDRLVRGSSSKRSMHSYGAAIDIDAEHNELGATKGHMSAVVIAAFKAEGWRWGGDYTGRKDWMHFEACS